MNLSRRRIAAIYRKELREYRRNRQIVITMAMLPLLFSVYPAIEIFALPGSAADELRAKQPLIYMLAIPAMVPATVAAYSVAGERQQNSLEPVLTTPIRDEEFLIGKALAALLPSLVVSYAVFGVFLLAVELFAKPSVAAAILRGPAILGELAFIPLITMLAIWAGVAISTRTADPRVATQLSVLVSFPAIAVTTVTSIGLIRVTAPAAAMIGVVLLIVDVVGWRVVAPLFSRERLITR